MGIQTMWFREKSSSSLNWNLTHSRKLILLHKCGSFSYFVSAIEKYKCTCRISSLISRLTISVENERFPLYIGRVAKYKIEKMHVKTNCISFLFHSLSFNFWNSTNLCICENNKTHWNAFSRWVQEKTWSGFKSTC